MTTRDKRPRCPKCGEPARDIVLSAARVVCELHPDGTPGNILSTSRPTGTAEYVCGGGHVWKYDPCADRVILKEHGGSDEDGST